MNALRDRITQKRLAARLDDLIRVARVAGSWLRRQHPRLVDLVLSCPSEGGGVHRWLFGTACELRRNGCSDDIITELLTAAVADCGREVPAREIEDAVRNSTASRVTSEKRDRQSSRPERRPPPSPKRNLSLIRSVALAGPGLKQLHESSPVLVEQEDHQSATLVDLLFPGDPLICCGRELGTAATMPKSWWLDRLADAQFIVPSTMSTRVGRTRDGRVSKRSLSNTGPRRYLVVEFDFKAVGKDGRPTPETPILAELNQVGRGVKDLCAALIQHLAGYAPLVLVVDSAGKSLHAWFNAVGVDERILRRFMDYAVVIGADPATWTPCQMVRLPGGLRRENGRRQETLFFNPANLPRP